MSGLSKDIAAQIEAATDLAYREFHAALVPGVEDIRGVRIPKMRDIAKKAVKEDWRSWLLENHDHTYEERMIQGMIIGYAGMDVEERRRWLDFFVPKIDNWAICDCCACTYKFMKKDQQEWFSYLQGQLESGTEYSIRFAVVCLMDFFLTEEWIDRVLAIYDRISHEGYYVKMAIAWGISMCYVKFPARTKELLLNNHLDDFTHNKAIQKIRESYRVSKAEKDALNTLKR